MFKSQKYMSDLNGQSFCLIISKRYLVSNRTTTYWFCNLFYHQYIEFIKYIWIYWFINISWGINNLRKLIDHYIFGRYHIMIWSECLYILQFMFFFHFFLPRFELELELINMIFRDFNLMWIIVYHFLSKLRYETKIRKDSNEYIQIK